MSECVFALIRLNLINDRKEMGGEKDAGSRGRKARRTEGGREGDGASERGGKHGGAQCGATAILSQISRATGRQGVFRGQGLFLASLRSQSIDLQ